MTDVDAFFVADPFMIQRDGEWSMYFEVMPRGSQRGVIGLAKSRDGMGWDYRGIVLAEEFHLSYPHAFAWGDGVFMTPEALDAGAVRLYRASPYPDRFRPWPTW